MPNPWPDCFLTSCATIACSVGIGYPPTTNLSQPNMGLGHPCTDGTSITGAVIVAVLIAGAFAAAGITACRRGEAAAKPSSPDEALATYLDAAGVAPPTRPSTTSQGYAGGNDAS